MTAEPPSHPAMWPPQSWLTGKRPTARFAWLVGTHPWSLTSASLSRSIRESLASINDSLSTWQVTASLELAGRGHYESFILGASVCGSVLREAIVTMPSKTMLCFDEGLQLMSISSESSNVPACAM